MIFRKYYRRMATNTELQDLVRSEAKKAGVSQQQANKALNMIKKGKIGMGSIAPQIKDMLSSGLSGLDTRSPQEKYRAKLHSMQDQRQPKIVKNMKYDKDKQQMEEDKKKQAEEKRLAKNRKRDQQRRHRKKLEALSQQMGIISFETYHECISRQKTDKYQNESDKNHDSNIIEIYHKQENFSDKINEGDIDDLLDD